MWAVKSSSMEVSLLNSHYGFFPVTNRGTPGGSDNGRTVRLRVGTVNSFARPDVYASLKLKLPERRISERRTIGAVNANVVTDEEVVGNALPVGSEDDGSPLVEKEDVLQCVAVLRNAAKTRTVAPPKIIEAIRALEKAKIDPSNFLKTIGGTESPGRTWMLIFTANKEAYKNSEGGRYFPITAVQRFDATAKRIENGIYLGPVGSLTFSGSFIWEKRKLAFLFDSLNVKIGPLSPFKLNVGKKEDAGRSANKLDPFFIWFYADDEIIVAKGRGQGVAFWCRCQLINT